MCKSTVYSRNLHKSSVMTLELCKKDNLDIVHWSLITINLSSLDIQIPPVKVLLFIFGGSKYLLSRCLDPMSRASKKQPTKMSGTSKRRSPASLLVIVESLLGVVPWEVPKGVNACDDSQAATFSCWPKNGRLFWCNAHRIHVWYVYLHLGDF